MFKYFFNNEKPEDDCKANETLAELGEIDSMNMMNAYVSHQELIENCFHYNVNRHY